MSSRSASKKSNSSKAAENISKTLAEAATKEKVVSPVLDVSTPEEEEKTMKDLYERPSPQPDESEQERDKKRHAETMTAPVTTEAVGVMAKLDKKDIADAEAQCDARETAHAQVQSTTEAASAGAQTEWTASTVLGVFMENAQLLSASELLSAISKATATLQSKMDTAN